MYRALDCTAVLATWIATSAKPDLTPKEFPASPLDFKEHVDRLCVRSGWFSNWIQMHFRCNKLPDFFSSDDNSMGKPWFDEHGSAGYRKVCQTHHDTDVVGWFLMSGPFTNHVFLENSIAEAMVRYLPTGISIEFRCYPQFQKALRPLDSDATIKDHPGVAKRDYNGYPAYRLMSVECETDKVWIMQGILRKLFNVHKDLWLRLKHYNVVLLPPPGTASEGSEGTVIRRKLLKAHVKAVFSLHETQTGIFTALDEPFVFKGKEHAARGVLLSVPWPISEDYELQDKRKPKATINPITGKHSKRLYHSVDQLIPADRVVSMWSCLATTIMRRRSPSSESFPSMLPAASAKKPPTSG